MSLKALRSLCLDVEHLWSDKLMVHNFNEKGQKTLASYIFRDGEEFRIFGDIQSFAVHEVKIYEDAKYFIPKKLKPSNSLEVQTSELETAKQPKPRRSRWEERRQRRLFPSITTGIRRKDHAWKYETQVEVSGEGAKKIYVYMKCNFCEKRITGGIKRLKDHLACTHVNVGPCTKVPDKVKKECTYYLKKFATTKKITQRNMKEMIGNTSYYGSQHEGSSSGSHQVSSNRGTRGPMDRFMINIGDDDNINTQELQPPTATKELRNKVCLDIARFIYENGISFNVVRSPSWINMLRSVGSYGRGLQLPSMYELRTWMLNEEFKTTSKMVDDVKKTWIETGITIMSDDWSDIRHRSIINFLINNPYGIVFMKSVDASSFLKDTQLLFEMLDEVVDEVGRMLMEKRPHLYWNPCAAHCIDLMLEKLGQLPQHKLALLKAKFVSKFIYNHPWRFKELRQPLEAMFASEEWDKSSWEKNKKENSTNYALKTTTLLVKVLRIVDGERTPAMGFIYEAMNRAKEDIAKDLGGQESAYKEIWDIIDEKWDRQLHQHLHAAAYYLNPQFHYDKDFHVDKEVKTGLYACMDILISEEDYLKVNDQLEKFHLKKGMLGFRVAQACYKTRSPERWSQFGDDVPGLKALQLKFLA
ncbi:uncharacterized protein LOC110098778 [Dendrobium catenatum]|uniref:uncharacterized protein LOC110098778 n=1 Tax=Dendrobium catenatum TaxID=906689 RepID=UPI0010A0BACF|nr:uncharacterized protein LOC110098778 [Dendrobium catenatum]